MGDMGDDFRALKEFRKKRKAQRYSDSASARTEIYKEALDVEEKNDGQHWIVRAEKETIDFWPSSGRWIVRGKKTSGYDARSLLKRIARTQ